MDKDSAILLLIGIVTLLLLAILYAIVRKNRQQPQKTQLDNSTNIEITQIEQKPQKAYQKMVKKKLSINIQNSSFDP